MSRCFPYPPPGYSRNGATYEALIESIKLQKENEEAKAERKKEKKSKKDKKAKKEKKEKGKRKDGEKAKAKKDPNEYPQDAQKLVKGSVDFKEVNNKKMENTIEQLERSDLTEEHGQPIISHKPSYSSDSTQNSSKRKRDEAILPDFKEMKPSDSAHGKPIKIRLLKKQRPDSSNELLSSNYGRTNPQGLSVNTGPSVTSLVSRNRYSGVPATSGRESNAAIGISLSQTKSTMNFGRPGLKSNDQQGLQYGKQQVAPVSALKQETRTSNLNKIKAPVPSQSIMSDLEGLNSIKRQAIPSRMDHGMGTSSSILPPASVSRKIDINGSGRDHLTPFTQVPPSNHLKHGVPNSDLNKPKSTVTGKRTINEIYINGPTKSEKKKQDSVSDIPDAGQKVRLSKSEKKKKKKHAKYEKLMGSLVLPDLQAQVLKLDDDEDWLSRSSKTARRSSSNDDVETCQDSVTSSLWQPCARFLADADIHAMPYTVPF